MTETGVSARAEAVVPESMNSHVLRLALDAIYMPYISRLLAEIVENPNLAKTMVRINADWPEFEEGLEARNVLVSPKARTSTLMRKK